MGHFFILGAGRRRGGCRRHRAALRRPLHHCPIRSSLERHGGVGRSRGEQRRAIVPSTTFPSAFGCSASAESGKVSGCATCRPAVVLCTTVPPAFRCSANAESGKGSGCAALRPAVGLCTTVLSANHCNASSVSGKVAVNKPLLAVRWRTR